MPMKDLTTSPSTPTTTTVAQHAYANYERYNSLFHRSEAIRQQVRSAPRSRAADILKHAYVFATMSTQTSVARAESAFMTWREGTPLQEAMRENAVLFPNNKAAWIEDTFHAVDFEALSEAIAWLMREGDHVGALRTVIEECKGVAESKAAFSLALSGYTEFMCIDSHVALHAGLKQHASDRLDFDGPEDYLSKCWDIHRDSGLDAWPPAIAQWAIFDFERGEMADHDTLYEYI